MSHVLSDPQNGLTPFVIAIGNTDDSDNGSYDWHAAGSALTPMGPELASAVEWWSRM